MPSPDSERLDALSEAFVRLLKRVDQMEERLARMDPAAAPVAAPVLPLRPPPLPPPLPPPIPPSLPHPPPPKPHLETRMGLTWINRIGAVTLIIGVAFFFKYAVDNQWIGETGRA